MKLKDLTLTAVVTAIIVVLTFITIPNPVTGVPITLQTFAICFAGYFLGVKKGLLSVVIYVLLGIIGLPIFAGFKGGISVLAGPTGGFIIGFIFMVAFCGMFIKAEKIYISLPLGVLGLAVCHILGIIQYSLYSGSSFVASAAAVSVPFMIKDIVSVYLAYLGAKLVKKALKNAKIEA